MFKRTKMYALGGGVKNTKGMAKGGASTKNTKGTKYMAKGGASKNTKGMSKGGKV